MNAIGKVYLVGAGCGGAKMLTLAAQKILAQVDVVVYDRLISDDILLAISPHIKLVDVGKAAGKHLVSQTEINEILIREARDGKNIARLKGGDPLLFARGAEEISALNQAEIPWEIVPGISSAFAVPELAGIPITQRGASSSVHLLTWRDQHGEPPSPKILRSLADTGGTLIIFMAASAKKIGTALSNAGFAENTPVAIIEKGATASAKIRRLLLGNLEKSTQDYPPQSPALIVVGAVAAIDFSASQNSALVKPLAGLQILVTATEPLNAEICAAISERGGESLPCPPVKTTSIDIGENEKKAVREATNYDWLVFTSSSGVDFFFAAYREIGGDWREFSRVRFAVIGDRVAAALRKHGFSADLIPEKFNGRALGEKLAARTTGEEKILHIHGQTYAQEFSETMIEKKRAVDDLEIYATVAAPLNYHAEKIIRERLFDGVVFASPSAVSTFVEIAKRANGSLDFSQIAAVCIGNTTANEARKTGMSTFVAANATPSAIADAAEKLRACSAVSQ